ncbi:hypothetical protein T09_10792 [Trichinella sp. T9]|nr:hypothetical protein T09_10792 [Trichinella sp. T9]
MVTLQNPVVLIDCFRASSTKLLDLDRRLDYFQVQSDCFLFADGLRQHSSACCRCLVVFSDYDI